MRLASAALPLVALAVACGGGTTGPIPEQRPTITVYGGDAQQALPGTHVPLPLRARVLDQGTPMVGVAVTWDVLEGGGTVEPLGSVTDAQGVASAGFIVGPAGNQRVRARAAGVDGSAEFVALSTLAPSNGLQPVAIVPVPANYGHHDTFVRDGIAFVCAWNSGVYIYDVGNGIRGGSPSAPVLVSQFVTASNGVPSGPSVHNAWWFHNPRTGEKRYLFIGQEGPGVVGLSASGDLHVVDVSDLASPQEVASLRIAGAGVHNFWMDEQREVLYAAWYNGGVVSVDVSGVLAGSLAGRVTAQGFPGGAGNSFTWGVMLDNGTLYASDMINGLIPMDPLTLQVKGGADVTDRWTSDLWVRGAVAYSGTWGSRSGNRGNAIKIWSLDNAGVPHLANTIELADVGTVSDIAVSPDGRLLVATAESGPAGGLYLFDRRDPLHPVLVSRAGVTQGLHTGEVKQVQGRTYVFAARNPPSPALMIFDITDVGQ